MSRAVSLSSLFSGFSRQGRALLEKYGLLKSLDLPSEGKAGDAAMLEGLALALMSGRGEASGVAIASDLLATYADAGAEDRAAFLRLLGTRFGPDPDRVDIAVARYKEEGPAALPALARAVEPPRQELLRRLNLAPGATAMLLRMREDLLRFRKEDPALFDPVDGDFVHLFASWFNRGFLTMREITWDSPASLLERVIRYEAVHDITDWHDLRNRLDPEDRRCFAFFHPALPGEPLIFVEVALTADLADTIQAILQPDRAVLKAGEASTAIFYSISNCQAGLKGISFGHFLIKQVATDLKRSLPNLTHFATLSPVPGFRAWLDTAALDGPDRRLAGELGTPRWWEGPEAEAMRDMLLRRMVEYFLSARTPSGRPVDPVARFHLGNGARLERINWLADRSANGLRQSAGMMVNYLYDLPSLEENHEAFAHRGHVATGEPFRTLARQMAAKPLPNGATNA
ncbi:MAG: malonyl-CoA decarboxylase [Sphingobium sp.]